MIEFVNFLATTDPKLVMDWAMAFLVSVSTVFVTVLGGSLVIKEVIEIWGLDDEQD